MKKLFFLLLFLMNFSCNKEIALEVIPPEISTPDYNLLSEGPGYLEYDSLTNKYSALTTLYLRPFENVTNLDDVTLKFGSNHFGSYRLKNDTLYNGDKINIKYGDFKNYQFAFLYLSEINGQHTVTVEATIRSVTKTTTITLKTH
ncbi:hypothetical protein ACS5NO_32360 [Larkinella sp. GY13]|uniref:hypothetical protein n=1 Tax=Larkinella sp. GY13 TaxID=3453720 RepID=UPI003EEE0267